jgi:general secretion pathway protein A
MPPMPTMPTMPTMATGRPSAQVIPALPQIVFTPGRRPLLDLFPMAPETKPAAPPPRIPPLRQAGDIRHPAPAASSEPQATYEMFYGLRERPFSLSTNPKFLYHSSEYDRVAQKMLAAIGQRDPLVVLTGEIGMGKTTLCRALVDQLDRRTLTSVVAEPFASMVELLSQLLLDFGVVSKDEVARGRLANATEEALYAALHDFLVSLAPLQAFAVVVIDEAQNLPAPLLDAIRLMVNALAAEHLMQIVLVGQPQLLTLIGAPRPAVASVASVASVACTLNGIAADEMSGYVMHRLRMAGDSPRVEFDNEAIERLNGLSGGRPRIVNILCDRALANGFGKSASVIDAELIDGAAEDLDLAPPSRGGLALGLAGRLGALVLLLLLGAAAGAFAFRGDVSAILAHWKHAPARTLQGAPNKTP